jgi:hypothetical protein
MSLLHRVQTGSVAHPVPYTSGIQSGVREDISAGMENLKKRYYNLYDVMMRVGFIWL